MERMKLPELGHGITPEGLEQLNAAISSGATSEGLLQGLEQQMLRANAMRDQNSGTRAGSPMMAMADSFANITGAVRGRQIGQQQNKQRGTLAKAKAAQAGEEQRRFMRDDSFKVLGKAMDQRRMQEAEGQNDIGNQQWNRNFNRGVLESDRSFNQSEQKRAADEAQQIIDNRRNWRSDNLEHGGGAPDTKIEPWKKGEETKNITERFNPETDRTEPYNVDEDRFIQPGEMEGYTPHKEFNPNSGSGGYTGVKFTRINKAEREDLQSAKSQLRSFDNLFEGIDNGAVTQKYRVPGTLWAKGLETLSTQDFVKLAEDPEATDEMRKAGRWWADFRSQVELAQRHGLFGSALTKNEQKLWDDAMMMKPGMNPTELKERMEILALSQRRHAYELFNNRLPSSFPDSDRKSLVRTIRGSFEYDEGNNSLIFEDADGTQLSSEEAEDYVDSRIQEYYAGSGQDTYQSGPKAGDVEGGYTFKGGDPKDPANWSKVQ